MNRSFLLSPRKTELLIYTSSYIVKMEGHEKLATFMTSHQEFAIFQRFDFLNTLNILYLQAELVEFEGELKRCMKQDLESDDEDRRRGARDWWFLASADEGETWETMLKARKVLKEYSKPR
jgi:hypothetical protein